MNNIRFQINSSGVGSYDLRVIDKPITEEAKTLAVYEISIEPNTFGIKLVSGGIPKEVYDRMALFAKIYTLHVCGRAYFWDSEFDSILPVRPLPNNPDHYDPQLGALRG
jgi:hypothetical protein